MIRKGVAVLAVGLVAIMAACSDQSGAERLMGPQTEAEYSKAGGTSGNGSGGKTDTTTSGDGHSPAWPD